MWTRFEIFDYSVVLLQLIAFQKNTQILLNPTLFDSVHKYAMLCVFSNVFIMQVTRKQIELIFLETCDLDEIAVFHNTSNYYSES